MKKLVGILLFLTLALSLVLVGCNNPDPDPDPDPTPDEGGEVSVMTYAQYMAAEVGTDVCVEAYVQAHQSWWDNKITVYLADEDGAYFVYELACSEADAAKLEAGTKIKVTGTKTVWAGEVEITDGTFEFVDTEDSYIAEPFDATALLGTDELVDHQNKLITFKGMTVVKVEYKNGEPGDDIYLTVSLGENEYALTVERYLTGPDTEVYKAVGALKAGDYVDIEGFLYWYEGVDTHITSVTKRMTYAEYVEAPVDSSVIIEAYVQAHQSWWDNKVTVYLADRDGAYFAYELACSEADSAKLEAGTKIRIRGTKAVWAGEVEIMYGSFEFIEGADTYVAEAFDATALLGTDELIDHQNKLITFKGVTVVKVEYKNGEPGDDIYLTVSLGENEYALTVERYLTGPDTEVYAAVGELVAGDVIDVEGFLYWYEGVDTHITAVRKAA